MAIEHYCFRVNIDCDSTNFVFCFCFVIIKAIQKEKSNVAIKFAGKKYSDNNCSTIF